MAAIDGIVASRGQTPPTLRPGDYLPSVNGATVASFEQDVEAIPFTRRAVTLRPLRVPAPARAMVRAATRLPGLREVTTSRIIARLTK
jgi:hypothetical protein